MIFFVIISVIITTVVINNYGNYLLFQGGTSIATQTDNVNIHNVNKCPVPKSFVLFCQDYSTYFGINFYKIMEMSHDVYKSAEEQDDFKEYRKCLKARWESGYRFPPVDLPILRTSTKLAFMDHPLFPPSLQRYRKNVLKTHF